MWLAWVELGRVQYDRGWYEVAAICFRTALEYVSDKGLFTILANVQLTFDPPAALESAKKALAMDPDWEEAPGIAKDAEDHIERHKTTGRYWEETDEENDTSDSDQT